jgi:hypothetical protein
MPAALPRSMPLHSLPLRKSQTLTPVVVVIRMSVAPVPIVPLFFHFQFDKGMVLAVPFAEVYTVRTVLIVIPVVIVLMVPVVDPVLVFAVSVVFFLASVLLRPARRVHCRGRRESCA